MNAQNPQSNYLTNWSDFSHDEPSIRDIIPDGVPLYLQIVLIPGGYNPPDPKTGAPMVTFQNLLHRTKDMTKDTASLKLEFTVLRGPYQGKKFTQNFTCVGGKVDERGNSVAGKISRDRIRTILDSAFGLSTKDETPAACAKRALQAGLKGIHGLKFFAMAKVVPPQGSFGEKNELGDILTIDQARFPGRQPNGALDVAAMWKAIDNPTIPTPKAAKAAPTPVELPDWAQEGKPADAPAAQQGQPVQPDQPVEQIQPTQQFNPLPDWAAGNGTVGVNTQTVAGGLTTTSDHPVPAWAQ